MTDLLSQNIEQIGIIGDQIMEGFIVWRHHVSSHIWQMHLGL